VRTLWVHAVSVGETRAAEPLIDALLAEYPSSRIVLTHMTPTGRRTSEALFGDRVMRAYVPYDYPAAVSRFLDHFRPRLGIIMETEIWPNLVHLGAERGVPMYLVNARLSERSYRAYRRVLPLVRATLRDFAGLSVYMDLDDLHQIMLEGPVVLRYGDNPKWMEEALSMPAPRAGGAGAAGAAPAGGRGGGRGGGAADAFNVNTFYREEGVLALFDRGGNGDMTAGGSDLTWQTQRVDGGTIFVQSGGSPTGDAATVLPQVTLAVEHYNRMVRLLEHNTPVKVDLEIDVATREETQPNGFNVVGEIPGTDKAGEIVLIGAHFDSWHGGTGATDNAAGSAAMMEVLRILKATGLKPRRTVRIGLWGAEEGGLLGSQAYVREHLGTRDEPKPDLARTTAYFNLDNGTGKIRGIWMQSNTAVKPIFEAWTRPLKDLGVEILGPRSVSQTDHTRFDSVGVPAFQFVQERYEYNSRTHHSNMDVYDRVQADDMKQIATVVSVFVWHAATREAMLPRKTQ